MQVLGERHLATWKLESHRVPARLILIILAGRAPHAGSQSHQGPATTRREHKELLVRGGRVLSRCWEEGMS